ncbi:MAG: polysaccharide deacetylase family protein [Candidatus Eisenbacteria bacterium]|nr:polysaccharide deacetylase family protein [Candidatus Eisenbacteria bacterium]
MHPAAFSFDIEDWYHSQLIAGRDRHAHGVTVVRPGTEAILDLLDRHGVRATFFVLGDVIREHPDLARRIVDEGHELGCHGMDHQPVWQLTPGSFRAQLQDFRALVEEAVGAFPVIGFRAPTFSIDRSTAWALDVLREQGYRYDSSIFPAKVKLYGVHGAPLGIYRPARGDLVAHDPAGDLVEFPVAVNRWGPLRVPVGGGFYLRALPYRVFAGSLDRILAARPVALYLHPREVVPETRRLALSPVNAFLTYNNLHTVRPKLEKLFRRYRWVTMREILERDGWLGGVPGSSAD